MELHMIGIDLGKTVFHLVGLNPGGEVVVRKKCSWKQLLDFTADLKVELVGMEACGGSHFLGRALREQGHEVRLIPAQYVKPYVKTNKNDYIDAEAIAEAVGRPRMRFVPIKTDDQLDLQSLHRVPTLALFGEVREANPVLACILSTTMGTACATEQPSVR
jgi:transposase